MKKNKVKREHSQKIRSTSTQDAVKDQSITAFRSALIQVSWRVATSVLFLSFLGIWLDRIFNTKPVLSISGITLSLIITFVVVKRYVEEAFPGSFGGKK